MKAIMYHYVRPHTPSLPYFRYLDLGDFRQQLKFFGEEYGFITKDAFVASVLSGAPPTTGIVLTFDDGLKDHHRFVLPELQKRGLWGIFYVPTSPLTTGRLLDVHRLHMLLGKYGGRAICDSVRRIVSDNMLSHAHIAEFLTETYRRQDNDAYTDYAKRLLNYYIDYKYRQDVIDKLMVAYFPDETHLVTEFYMIRDEILQLHNAGMVIGSHTVNHFVMSKLALEDQEREISGSFSAIEDIVGETVVKTFCYPYGGFHTFTRETERLLADNGCLFSFNVEARDVEQRDLSERRQALPRYDCNQFPYGQCRNVSGADSVQ